MSEVELKKLQGIGPKVAMMLVTSGIETPEQLKEVGAMEAYLRIIEAGLSIPHLSLLYALVGAVENRHWNEVAQNNKARLRAELEGLLEMGVLAKHH